MDLSLSAPQTINSLISQSCRAFADKPALGFAFEPALSYGELCRQVARLAWTMHRDGIDKGDRVAILAENSPQWGIAYLATVRLGAIAVPILPDFLESDVHHILRQSPVKALFITKRQIAKIVEFKQLDNITVITLDDSRCDREIIHTRPLTTDYLQQTTDVALFQLAELDDKLPKVAEDDLASIIYTSGTSGHSKAVMLSHGNLTANVRSMQQIVNYDPSWTFLSILPLSHTYEFTVGFLLPIVTGMRIVYAANPPTPKILEKICKAERPNVLCVVPMVMEKIYKKRILGKIEKSLLLKTAMYLGPLRKQIHRQIAAKLLDFFGGNLNILGIGGAPLNPEVEKFLHDGRFPYLVGYGLTEASPLLAAGPCGDPRIPVGSTGKPIPQVEIKIMDPAPDTGIGEIYARGPNIMQGYFNNPELTRETVTPEGWLITGDLGFLDRNNYLTIKGRSKSVIVLSSGENIYPEAIEEKINSDYHVVESLVVDSNDQLVALVHLDYELIDLETQGNSPQQKLAHINEILHRLKKSINAQLPPYAKIATVVEREEPFTKTATHKIKRYLYTRNN